MVSAVSAAPAVVSAIAVAAAVGASGGAVGGAVTVAVDCCYGPCKISLLVIKISNEKKRERIMHRGLETSASRVLHSHPRIHQ